MFLSSVGKRASSSRLREPHAARIELLAQRALPRVLAVRLEPSRFHGAQATRRSPLSQVSCVGRMGV